MEYPPNVLRVDARVSLGSVCSDAHLVLRAVSCTAVEADCLSCGARCGYLVQASTQGLGGWLSSIIVVLLCVVKSVRCVTGKYWYPPRY